VFTVRSMKYGILRSRHLIESPGLCFRSLVFLKKFTLMLQTVSILTLNIWAFPLKWFDLVSTCTVILLSNVVLLGLIVFASPCPLLFSSMPVQFSLTCSVSHHKWIYLGNKLRVARFSYSIELQQLLHLDAPSWVRCRFPNKPILERFSFCNPNIANLKLTSSDTFLKLTAGRRSCKKIRMPKKNRDRFWKASFQNVFHPRLRDGLVSMVSLTVE